MYNISNLKPFLRQESIIIQMTLHRQVRKITNYIFVAKNGQSGNIASRCTWCVSTILQLSLGPSYNCTQHIFSATGEDKLRLTEANKNMSYYMFKVKCIL